MSRQPLTGVAALFEPQVPGRPQEEMNRQLALLFDMYLIRERLGKDPITGEQFVEELNELGLRVSEGN